MVTKTIKTLAKSGEKMKLVLCIFPLLLPVRAVKFGKG